MTRFIFATVVVALALSTTVKTNAQFFEKLKKHIEKKVEKEAENRTNKKADDAVNQVFDSVEKKLGVSGTQKNSKKTKKSKKENSQNGNVSNTVKEQEPEKKEPTLVWAKFDFVPGDKVIFEDGPSPNEENGEFPSRWDLYSGSAEIAEFEGETVIMFLGGGEIIPYLKNPQDDYLPDVFTIEFDAYFKPGKNYARYWLNLNDIKNQSNTIPSSFEFYVNGIDFMNTSKRYPGTEKYNWGVNPEIGWRHFSIAYTRGKLKAYMDDTRLINIPHLEGNPTGVTIKAENKDQMFIKNIRIAAGGVKYYDRVLSEGKIIVNGIKFDVDKATLKPESMGPINRIYKLMTKNPDLRFSVEGHTDSDGDEAHNMELSKARAKTVMDKLVSMGISPDRLKYTGWGESKPIDTNATAEGKANNRRVEFVKF